MKREDKVHGNVATIKTKYLEAGNNNKARPILCSDVDWWMIIAVYELVWQGSHLYFQYLWVGQHHEGRQSKITPRKGRIYRTKSQLTSRLHTRFRTGGTRGPGRPPQGQPVAGEAQSSPLSHLNEGCSASCATVKIMLPRAEMNRCDGGNSARSTSTRRSHKWSSLGTFLIKGDLS